MLFSVQCRIELTKCSTSEAFTRQPNHRDSLMRKLRAGLIIDNLGQKILRRLQKRSYLLVTRPLSPRINVVMGLVTNVVIPTYSVTILTNIDPPRGGGGLRHVNSFFVQMSQLFFARSVGLRMASQLIVNRHLEQL